MISKLKSFIFLNKLIRLMGDINKKAQYTIEFLTTYGWAILILLIVLSAFASLYVFKYSKCQQNFQIADDGFFLLDQKFMGLNSGTPEANNRFFIVLQNTPIASSTMKEITILKEGVECGKFSFPSGYVLSSSQKTNILQSDLIDSSCFGTVNSCYKYDVNIKYNGGVVGLLDKVSSGFISGKFDGFGSYWNLGSFVSIFGSGIMENRDNEELNICIGESPPLVSNSTSTFVGWSNCDIINGMDCTLSINANKTITAEFTSSLGLSTFTGTLTSISSGGSDLLVYNNSLSGGWSDISWSATNNFSSTQQIYSAPYSIKTNLSNWGGLQLRYNSDIDVSLYNNLEFRIYNPSVSNKLIEVTLVNNAETEFSSSDNTFTITPGSWNYIQIPLTTLNPSKEPIRYFWIQNFQAARNTFYVDDLKLTGSGGTPQYSLTFTGDGEGTITSFPAGINCVGDCNEVYNEGTSITLTATPYSGPATNLSSGGIIVWDLPIEGNCNASLNLVSQKGFNNVCGANVPKLAKGWLHTTLDVDPIFSSSKLYLGGNAQYYDVNANVTKTNGICLNDNLYFYVNGNLVYYGGTTGRNFGAQNTYQTGDEIIQGCGGCASVDNSEWCIPAFDLTTAGFDFDQINNIDILLEDYCFYPEEPHAGGMSDLSIKIV